MSLPVLAQSPRKAQVWLTTHGHQYALSPMAPAVFGAREALPIAIEVDATDTRQAMVGFGASITDASAYLIQGLAPDARAKLLEELFGRQGDGIGLSFARLTIGASDFSRSHYTLDDTPGNAPDPQLTHFSIAPNLADVVPVTKAALAINPQLKVMASPWSAPAWMKSNRNLIQGTLDPAAYDAFARYLLEYVDAYAEQGILIWALTVQNEPDFEPKDYPGMRFNAPARARFIGGHLGPLLAARGSSAPLLFDWDHNWNKPHEPLGVLNDAKANPFVNAVAWHCYGGTPDAQSPVHAAFPDKDVYMTECSGGDWEPLRSGGLTLQARRLIIESVRHDARGVLFWNLALDQDGGPHAGGCDTCRGVVDIDTRDGALTRTDEYYALAHASRFVPPGAHRVGSSEEVDGVDNVAFVNPDGGRVLVVTNSAPVPRTFSVREGDSAFHYTLPGKSLATFTWSPAP
ncbi:glycoside hydrolase family 30 beta sandwich domain-containing protein [Pseudoxanthomonas sp. GM95]|uniref:glycoside hydrolase family 30 protein n=1 Tax=Pseudoxanthomonas sp. GM95 TaxID=1881043 RepID=UPI000B841BE3|nr:glycoside hydrolase family 30 beta sandwich domain-containing protein [Pseudoxanthomonas sp. GM95]